MYRKETEGWLKHYDFIILDIICLQLAFVLAYAASGQHEWNPYKEMLYRNMAIFLTLADLLVIFSLDTLKGVLKRDTLGRVLDHPAAGRSLFPAGMASDSHFLRRFYLDHPVAVETIPGAKKRHPEGSARC